MSILTEFKKLEKNVLAFELYARNFIDAHMKSVVATNPNIKIYIKDNYVMISDILDGEAVEYNVYVSPEDRDQTSIEVIKNGVSMGFLSVDSPLFEEFKKIVDPIQQLYLMFFSWDGVDFVNKLKE